MPYAHLPACQRSGLRWVFYAYALLMAVNLLVVWRMPVFHGHVGQGRCWSGVRRLLSDPRWAIFLAIIFISGTGQASIHNFLFLHLKSLGGSQTLMGLALTFATFSELPAFFFASRLVTRWGARRLLGISLFTLVLRLLANSWVPAAWMILPLQLLHGLTFSALWAAGVTYAQEISPAGLGATGQGLFTAVFFGLAGMLGAVTGLQQECRGLVSSGGCITLDTHPLAELAAILNRCSVFVGNDSGITHLAAAAGVPVVSLFGPTDPRVWGPRGNDVTILGGGTACSPCSREKMQNCAHQTCLEHISVEEVYEAVVQGR